MFKAIFFVIFFQIAIRNNITLGLCLGVFFSGRKKGLHFCIHSVIRDQTDIRDITNGMRKFGHIPLMVVFYLAKMLKAFFSHLFGK